MNKKTLVAALAAAGIVAGGGAAAAMITATSATASTVGVTTSTSTAPQYGPLASLVTGGTITQSQATAIHDALRSYVRDHRGELCDGDGRDGTQPMLAADGPLKAVLDQLVAQGTINQSQSAAVTNAIRQWAKEHGGSGPHAGRGGHGLGMMDGSRMGPAWAGSSPS